MQTPDRRMKHKFTLLVGLSLLTYTIGCTFDPLGNMWAGKPLFGPPKAYPVRKLTEDDILAIARRAITANETWIEQAQFETPRRESDDSGWHVIVWRLPKTPDGLRRVCIDDRGNVTCYRRGN